MSQDENEISENISNELITLEQVRKNYEPGEEKRIIKNLVVAGLSFVLLFSSYGSVVSIQSSLHGKNGLGAYSLATIYISGCVSSLFFLSFILSKFSCKDALFYSIFPYLAYMTAQFYPNFATLIPTGVILGISGGIIWNSVSSYISQISQEYSYLTGEELGSILARFFGLFFLLFQSSTIWGNLILATVFSTAGETVDVSASTTNSSTRICGADFCPIGSQQQDTSNSTTFPILPPTSTLHILFSLYFGCLLLTLVIIRFWLDPLTRYGEGCKEMKRSLAGKQLIFATIKQMRNPYQIALIPFIFFSTSQSGFFRADFNAAYVTCAWGMQNIGKIMICYGICSVSSSLLFSRMIKFTGRLPVFSIIIAMNVTANVLMLKWSPDPSQPIGFFIIAGLYGATQGVMSPQISAFSALIFADNKEAAFNNMRLWQSVGFIIAYINSTIFCIESKLYLIIGIALFGLICYFIVEITYTKSFKSRDVIVRKS